MDKSVLMVLSGPSGVGKDTIVEEYTRRYGDMIHSISSTTRERLGEEKEGVDYYFISVEEFERRIERGDFLEYAEVHGNYYGTSKEVVTRLMGEGKNVLLEIDPQGAMQVRKSMDEAVLVFIYPPSLRELERRIRERKRDTPEQIELRLRNATAELQHMQSYDYAIENKDIGLAVEQLHTVLMAEQLRAFRVRQNWDPEK